MKAQGALEYIVIIAAVLGTVSLVVVFLSGAFTTTSPTVSITQCRLAASNCLNQMTLGVSTTCPSCNSSCVDPVTGEEIFIGATFLCEQGRATEIESEGNYVPVDHPNTTTLDATIRASIMMSPISGTLATNGSHIFVKRWGGSTPGIGNFTIVGTGRGGTIKGQNYGTAPQYGINPWSSSATYHGDGFVYVPFNCTEVRKLNITSWGYSRISVPPASNFTIRYTGLMSVNTWYSGEILLTSNRTHIFNIAYRIGGGSVNNGFLVKIYDPANNFALVKQFSIYTPSYELRGAFAAGKYIYGIEWCDCNTARVVQIDTETETIVDTTTINQADTRAAGGQYDWVNDRVLLGSWESKDKIYEYSLPISTASLVDSYGTAEISGGGVGSLATDGKYLYVRRLGTYHGAANFTRIGTGFEGTIAGAYYGTLPFRSSQQISVTYYSDGFLYNPIYANAYALEKIDPATGVITTASVPSGLIRYESGQVAGGNYILTSDGKYIYNIAYNIDCYQCRNGYRVKIFDPVNGWSVVKQFDYFCAAGKLGCTAAGLSYALPNPTLYAAGRNLYVGAWYEVPRRMFQMDTDTGQVVAEWQSPNGAISAAYDWTNDQVYTGEIEFPIIYRFSGH